MGEIMILILQGDLQGELYIHYWPKVWTHLLIQCVSFIFMTIYIVDSSIVLPTYTSINTIIINYIIYGDVQASNMELIIWGSVQGRLSLSYILIILYDQ